jgi:hypothetical protein
MSDHREGEPMNPMNGAGVRNGEVHIPADDFRDGASSLIGEVEPEELLRFQPHAYASAGVSMTQVNSEPSKAVALLIAQELFDEDPPIDLHDATRSDLKMLDPIRFADSVRVKVSDPAIEPLPDGSDLKGTFKRLKALSGVISGPSTLRSELERLAEAQATAICRSLYERFVRGLERAPRAVGTLSGDVVAGLTQMRASSFDARPALQRVERVIKRMKAVEDAADQLTPAIRQRARVRLWQELSGAFGSAVLAVVAQACHVVFRRVVSRNLEPMRAIASEARNLVRRQQFVLEAFAPGSANQGSAFGDEGGGRFVTLTGRDSEELRRRILERRGCHDLTDVARAYRDELGSHTAPRTDSDAVEFAVRLRRMVAADCGSESIYSLIAEARQAVELAAELYSRAFPFVSLRLASEELGVCMSRYEHVEISVADDTSAHQEIRRAILAELHRLSGGRVRVIDRPANVVAIRVLRTVCGYPSVCDQTGAPLRAGYQLIQPLMKHGAHPTRSRLVPPNGCLQLNGPLGGPK